MTIAVGWAQRETTSPGSSRVQGLLVTLGFPSDDGAMLDRERGPPLTCLALGMPL